MTTAEITGAILTSDDVKALRQCDQASFSHTGKTNGEGRIRCIKKLEKDGPFGDTEREYLIVCESTVRYYTGESLNTASFDTEFKCHELLYNYTSSVTEFGTMASLVKIGDELKLHWIGSCNGYTRSAGLHMDTLHVHLKRGKQSFSFMLSTSICPDNSARMIRRH